MRRRRPVVWPKAAKIWRQRYAVKEKEHNDFECTSLSFWAKGFSSFARFQQEEKAFFSQRLTVGFQEKF